MSDLERGARHNYSPDTLAAIEQALGWAPGAVGEILAGRSPQPEDGDLSALLALWPALDERERRVLLAVARVLGDS